MKKVLIAVIAAAFVFVSTARVSSVSTCSAPGFAAAESIRVGADPQAVAVGDLNNDGRNDVVTANSGSNNISILLGAGRSYLPPVNVSVGATRPFAVAIADFNEDNKNDVVTVNVISHNLSIMIGDGAGGFTSTTQITAGPDPLRVVTADFNGDDNVDLAVTNSNPATVNVLLGNGSGAFGSSITTATSAGPVALTSADFNLDGKADLALANRFENTISVLLGTGTGTFQLASSPTVGNEPQHIASADFNGDGKPDLAVANLSPTTVSILLSTGDGTFVSSFEFHVGSPINSIAISDFNNDAHLDLAASSNAAGVVLRLGDGSGNFSIGAQVTRALGPFLIAADDFNRDGISDLVAVGTQSDTLVALAGDGQGKFLQTPNQDTGTNAISVALADFNSDGKLDSVVANESPSTVSVRFGNGTNTFGNASNFTVGSRPFWVATGDFNSDTKPDIVTANFLASLSVLINDGTGNFGAAVTVSLGSPPGNPLFVAVSDINNDNKPDLLVTRNSMSVVTVLLGDGAGGFSAPVNHPTAGGPQTIATGDFNGDNKVDLAVADGSFSILLGDGLGAFGAPIHTNFGVNHGPRDIVAHDFNGDSKLDIAIANNFTNDVSVVLGNGNATFAPRLNFNVGIRPDSLKAADFNGDGFLDLVAGNEDTGDLTVLQGNGAGSFGSPINLAMSSSPNSLALGDVNNDTDTDIVAVGFNTLNVLINQCGTSDTPPPTALLSINDVTMVEGDTGVTDAVFTVSLNAPSAQTVTAKFFASSITAQRVGDFQPTIGLVSFAPGETSKNVFVGIVGDTTDEFDEKVAINLHDATNALIADRMGAATITDNDAPPSVSIFDSDGSETTGILSLGFGVSQPSGKLVSVDFATANGTATSGSDFVSKSGTASIPAGVAMGVITVDIINDSEVEPTETLTVTISNPFNASLNDSVATGNILDNDQTIINLSGNSFVGNEGSAEITVNVVRSGPLANETFVSYATTDGTANDRGDYSAALGRLRFAPGEQLKTIKVLVTDDVFDEANETFTIALSDPVGAILGPQSSATMGIVDNDSANGISPVRDANFNAEFFVRQHYADFLNRTPDSAGLAFWLGQMTNCGNPDLLVCRINVSAAFYQSIEFQETGYLAYRTHKTAFGNLPGLPVPIRQRPFLADTRRVGEGFEVGVGNWEEVLEGNKVAYFNEFVTRAQFVALYGAMTNAAYVDALNANAGSVLAPAQRDELVNNLNAATMTRAQVLRAVAENQTLRNNEFNRAFVLLQYFGYLRRDPDATPDSNFDGFNFWLTKLNQFNGNFIQAEMVKAFIQSIEYADRFGQ